MIQYYSMEILELKHILPDMTQWVDITKVTKGWSLDHKFKVTNAQSQNFLLRLTEITNLVHTQTEFDLLSQMNLPNISTPIEIGLTNDNAYVYTIYNWIEGEDTINHIQSYTKIDQYKLGIECGKHLRLIHQIPIKQPNRTWEYHYTNKINRKIEQLKNCPLALENSEIYLKCIKDTIHLLKNRTYTFQHGDFHIGNTLIKTNGDLCLIDFNRHDIGDPWEEFNRIPFSVELSPEFASGSIDGYFDHNVPEDFFPLLALYTSVNQISSLPWAIAYGEKEISTMIRLSKQTLEWYDNFSTFIPKWYCSKSE